MTLTEMVAAAHANAKSKGWWDGEEHNIPEKLALSHSEVSEALEDYRKGSSLSDWYLCDPIVGCTHTPQHLKPEGFPSELADVIIRVADLCGHLGIDLDEAVKRKMAYNATREYRHGGKKA
jgi:NTP pyrophosphatase (non-canonical NTP hydrolase)